MARPLAGGRLDLVGRDLKTRPPHADRAPRFGPALLALLLALALAIAALRVDLIRVRYGLADALGQERALLEQRREALARLRTLRDPARLASLAEDYGLTRPARIIDLPLLPAAASPVDPPLLPAAASPVDPPLLPAAASPVDPPLLPVAADPPELPAVAAPAPAPGDAR